MPRQLSTLEPATSASSALRFRLTVTIVGVAVVLALVVGLTTDPGQGQDALVLVGLGDVYGFLASGLLYLTLLISPLTLAFPRFPGKTTLFLARRGLGVSSLVFALPHAFVSFFGPLGGFPGIRYLDPYTGWAVVLGTVALVILVALGATASDGAVRLLGTRRWKALHRTVYVAGVLTLVHLFLVGTHYGNPQSPWTFWTLVALGVLFVLEALRLDVWWAKKFPKDRRYGPATLLVVVLLTAAWFWTTGHGGMGSGVRWIPPEVHP